MSPQYGLRSVSNMVLNLVEWLSRWVSLCWAVQGWKTVPSPTPDIPTHVLPSFSKPLCWSCSASASDLSCVPVLAQGGWATVRWLNSPSCSAGLLYGTFVMLLGV